MLSWKKLGIDHNIVLLVILPFTMKQDVCWYSVTINVVSKSLNVGRYVGYLQYEFISKFWNAHSNVYGKLVEGAMNSRCISKNTRSGIISKSPTRLEWFEKLSLGCLKIMGQVTKINLFLSVPVIFQALSVLEEWYQWK